MDDEARLELVRDSLIRARHGLVAAQIIYDFVLARLPKEARP